MFFAQQPTNVREEKASAESNGKIVSSGMRQLNKKMQIFTLLRYVGRHRFRNICGEHDDREPSVRHNPGMQLYWRRRVERATGIGLCTNDVPTICVHQQWCPSPICSKGIWRKSLYTLWPMRIWARHRTMRPHARNQREWCFAKPKLSRASQHASVLRYFCRVRRRWFRHRFHLALQCIRRVG